MTQTSLDLFATNADQGQEYVVGKVLSVFFASADSFYKVMLVGVTETSLDWHEDEMVVTGNFADIKDETSYKFTGRQVEHPKYGLQFQADNYANATPTSRTGLIHYLSGDDFPGIGQKTATKVVDALGNGAIQKILNDATVLDSVGLKDRLKATLLAGIQASNGTEQVIIGLNGYGFGSTLTAAIFNRYKAETLSIIRENPYRLAEDIDGVSFKKADSIAAQLEIQADAPERLQAGLLQTLTDLSMANGDTYTTAKPLLTQTMGLLESARNVAISPDLLASQLIELAKAGKVVGDNDRIYLKSLYDAEWQVAEQLNRLMQADSPDDDTDAIQKGLRVVEKQTQLVYDASQTAALTQAAQSQVFLLTGGPGTGKTTIIRGLVHLFAELHEVSLDLNQYQETPFPVVLAAPTGRAAKRMSETTGLPASTIHRLLGLTGRETDLDAAATKDLEGGLLIIDEMSMVDVFLFKALLRAIPTGMQVVLVGDKDQLPSVGPGQVFFDLLATNQLPKVELETIYRQEDRSSIIPLAHAIKAGHLPTDFAKNQPDRSFFRCSANQVESVISQVVTRAKARGFSADQIQVLAPMYRGAAGIDRLNQALQNILNPKGHDRTKEVTFRNQVFRIGDKVLHLVNDPEKNVFNGDIGTIVGLSLATDKDNKTQSDQLTLAFDQTEVTYGRQDWTRLTLAYCMSIHKAQGSEFKLVILPMVTQYYRMLKRNLLYTAVTRAADMLILLGEEGAFRACVENQSTHRHTTLQERLLSVMPAATSDLSHSSATPALTDQLQESAPDPGPQVLTPALIQAGQIDPMIGMAGIRPQDFMPTGEE